MTSRLLPLLLAGSLLAAPLLLAISPGPAVAATAPAPDGAPDAGAVTWTLQPATGDAADGRLSLRQSLAPGTSAADSVLITNFSGRPATFAVYGSDGTVTADGNFDLIPLGQTAVDSGNWIRIGETEGSTPRTGGGIVVEVPAVSTLLIPVGIDVPLEATPGDHPAGIVAELIEGDQTTVKFATRVGVRVHLRVLGDIAARLQPEKVSAEYVPSWNPFAPGTLRVAFDVANAGNVRLGSAARTSVTGPFGVLETAATVKQREIFPAGRASGVVELPVWPLFAEWGAVTVVPSVVGEDDVDVELSAAGESFVVVAIPWSQLVLLVAGVGGFFLIRTLRRRAKKRGQARFDAAVAAAARERVPSSPERAELSGSAGEKEPVAASAQTDDSRKG